ncbi:MAG: hypothetical protein RLZZ618_1089 [Pseudomonadota bacterium]|jgi:peptidoglycan/LPS O-acetylase OafA/YrhL
MQEAGRGHERLLFLDWLRILAFGVLVLYHVGMVYVSWDYHVKSPFAGPALEPWMQLSMPWRMSLLFMVSGAVTSHMLRRGGLRARMRQRSLQLLLPLLLGMAIIVPPQTYVEVLQRHGYTGSLVDFMGLYVTGYDGFCDQGHCLSLPTWNHLWFLPYLWVYTLLLCALMAFLPHALSRAARLTRRVLQGPWLLLVPVAVVFSLRVLLLEGDPSATATRTFNHLQYFGAFMCGAMFAKTPAFWDRLAVWRWPALIGAILAWAVLVTQSPAGGARQGVIAIEQWGALVAAFGFARRHLDVDHPFRRTLTEAVFPVYLVHQTIIVVGAWWLFPLHWQPGFEGLLLIVATFALSGAVYAVVRRVSPLRPWFGLPARPAVGAARAVSGDAPPVVDPR